MTSSKQQLQFILDQLASLEEISSRPMMGEFILYYRGKIIGGIYDNRLLVKPVQAALNYIKNPVLATPYEGAKKMLLIEEIDDKDYLTGLFKTMYAELPEPKQKSRQTPEKA